MGHLGCLELADEAVEALVEEKEKMKRRQEAFLGIVIGSWFLWSCLRIS